MSYENGKIYKVVSTKTDLVYIGSTADTLKRRFASHKCSYRKNHYPTCSVSMLFELGIEFCSIELIEEYPCASRKELEKREGTFQKQYGNLCVNRQVAGRTAKEYYQDKKDYIKVRQLNYYYRVVPDQSEARKKLLEKNPNYWKDYYQRNKEKLAQ